MKKSHEGEEVAEEAEMCIEESSKKIPGSLRNV